LPLVLTHGWPGSVVEFHDVIDPLIDPVAHGGAAEDAFDVVCPSLPGYGWSTRPTEPGWGIERIAAAWAALMAGLGYERYGAQGGDWGAGVTTALGSLDRDHVAGVHLNLVVALPDPETFDDLTDAERSSLDSITFYQEWDSGYSKQQSTRPQTLGYGLVDSPAAQCAWIMEKFYAWSDCDGHPENVFARDRLLDNVMAYWLPRTGASSARLYWESFNRARLDSVDVPIGCSVFPKEIFRPSRRWAEKQFSDIRYWGEPERGGHFAAFERPELFVNEVRASFRSMR
jgi:pimeloyl-ACP methyl ester carboxylesterase